jgi:hypothetical protein
LEMSTETIVWVVIAFFAGIMLSAIVGACMT